MKLYFINIITAKLLFPLDLSTEKKSENLVVV